jgi:hypothetical protein
MQMRVNVNRHSHEVDPGKHGVTPTFIEKRRSNGLHIAIS